MLKAKEKILKTVEKNDFCPNGLTVTLSADFSSIKEMKEKIIYSYIKKNKIERDKQQKKCKSYTLKIKQKVERN